MRDTILNLDKQLARNEERLAALPGIEATLERYRKAGVEDRLKEQSRLILEEQLFVAAREEIDALGVLVDAVREGIPLGDLPRPDTARDGQRAVALARELGAVLKDLETATGKPLQALETALATAHRAVDQRESDWEGRKKDIEKKLGAALRKLQREQIDGQEFITLRRELEKLRPLRQECDSLIAQRGRFVEARRKLLVEREALLAADLRDLERAANAVTKRLGKRVRVTVEPQADRTPLLELVARKTSGRIKETLDVFGAADQLSARDLADRIREVPATIVERYGVSPNQAERLSAMNEEATMEIEEIAFPTETTIELNLGRTGDLTQWQRLENLSKGQKATAILLLVLLESEGPLIVDQPEDDLDNTFISDDVVPTVRREKPRAAVHLLDAQRQHLGAGRCGVDRRPKCYRRGRRRPRGGLGRAPRLDRHRERPQPRGRAAGGWPRRFRASPPEVRDLARPPRNGAGVGRLDSLLGGSAAVRREP